MIVALVHMSAVLNLMACMYLSIAYPSTQGLKAEFNTLAPTCAACVENGQSLSERCEAGEPKVALERDVSELQAKWEKLEKLFGDLLVKLTEALVQVSTALFLCLTCSHNYSECFSLHVG